MDAKFTKGPWKMSEVYYRRCGFDPKIVITPQGQKKKVCTVQDSGMAGRSADVEKLKANANLISAAPELLEACEKTVARLNQLIQPNMLENTILEDLEQAIAKAEGRSI